MFTVSEAASNWPAFDAPGRPKHSRVPTGRERLISIKLLLERSCHCSVQTDSGRHDHGHHYHLAPL